MSPELSILYEALNEPIGLCVAVSDFTRAQARLYAARRNSNDPSLGVLQVRRSPINPDFEIWITRSDARVPQPAPEPEPNGQE